LNQKELYYHSRKSTDYIKDIIETKKQYEALRELKYINDSASPSLLLYTKEDMK
jgi:hypothetical protein